MSGGLTVMHVIEAMHQGGAESLIVEHARHAAPDVRTLVCALNRGGPALELAERAGAKTFLLEKGGGRLAGILRIARLLADEHVDVVNGHNPTGGLYAALAGALARTRAVVRTEHSVHYPGRHSRAWGLGLEAFVTALTRRVVCVCEASRASHARRLRWAERRFVTVLNGVSAISSVRPRQATRADLGLEAGAPVALAVGSLTRQKAHSVLIDAFAAVARDLPRARLLIAGEGALRGALEERIARLGLAQSVRLLGARGDVADLLEAADLFVLSSEREGLSVTLLEAMRAGRPSAVTRVGGNDEAVADGVTGIVVPCGDPVALTRAIGALLSDPERSARLGVAARARWTASFTAERMVSATENVYREALGVARLAPASTATPEGRRASA
jgi:glycosyltransferase involved in cell wall biosynthesis